MTRYAPLWQQNGTYPAGVDRAMISTLWPASGSTGAAAVTVVNTMNVSVAAGTAAVAMSAGNLSELCRWDAAEVVTLTAAPPSGQSRIDLVVLQVRDAAIDAGSNNDFMFQAIAGTPATTGSQVAPAAPTNSYPVCQVLVTGGQANLNGATITDQRVPLFPRDTLHARWARAAAYSFPIAATAVPLDTMVNDPAGLWVPGSVGFRIPLTGIWQISAQFVAAAATWMNTQMWDNGSTFSQSFKSFAAQDTAVAIMTAKLTAGHLLQVATQSNAAQASVGGAPYNYVCLDYVGTG